MDAHVSTERARFAGPWGDHESGFVRGSKYTPTFHLRSAVVSKGIRGSNFRIVPNGKQRGLRAGIGESSSWMPFGLGSKSLLDSL
jgi:hypothetical protein